MLVTCPLIACGSCNGVIICVQYNHESVRRYHESVRRVGQECGRPMEMILKIPIVLKNSLSISTSVIRIFLTRCVMFKRIFYIHESLICSLRCMLLKLPFLNSCLIFVHNGAGFMLLSRSLFIPFLLIHCLFTGQRQIHNVTAVNTKTLMQCDILNVCVSSAFGLNCNISAD